MASGEVTALLLQWSEGDQPIRERLMRLVYRELHGLAERALKSERRDHTLQPTALVHETYQKLIDQRRVQWRNRAHFFAVAATIMRRILVDHARRLRARRRGAATERVSIESTAGRATVEPDVDVLALDEALRDLAELDPGQARIVELRFFAGLSVSETAEVVGVSRATVHREWAMARAWLHHRLFA